MSPQTHKRLALSDFAPDGVITFELQLHGLPPIDGSYYVPSSGLLGELTLSEQDSTLFLDFLAHKTRRKMIEPRLTYLRCDHGELGFVMSDFDLTRMLGCCHPCSDDALTVNVAILNWKQSLHMDENGVQWRRRLAAEGLEARAVIYGETTREHWLPEA